jgi:hypothetical protein
MRMLTGQRVPHQEPTAPQEPLANAAQVYTDFVAAFQDACKRNKLWGERLCTNPDTMLMPTLRSPSQFSVLL